MIIINEDEDDPERRPEGFLQRIPSESVLNINHDYRYLKLGYYVSAHTEMYGQKVIPSTEEILDAYRNPLLINKAQRHGIKTSNLSIKTYIDNNMKDSLMLFAITPFTNNSMTITNPESNLPEIIKRMSMGAKYPVALHSLKGEVKEVIQIFGESTPETSEFTQKFYKVFNIPICKLILQIDNYEILLSHCEPCKKKEVNWNLVREKVKDINIH